MPSENKTPNYGLNQWKGSEYPKRTDFNEDNDLIDAALAAHTTNTTAHIAATERTTWNAAVQSATIGGSAVTKSGTTLQLPAYPTTLPANGGTAADTTAITSSLTVSTAAPTSTLAAGKLWGVYG